MISLRSLATAALALGVLVADPPGAAADTGPDGCTPRDEVIARLSGAFGERLHGAGANEKFGLIELYVSETGSWTLLLTRPDGTSCPVAAGRSWSTQPQGEPGEPA